MEASAQCGCGEFELRVSSPPVVQIVCHCKECQAFSGAGFVKGAFFKKEDCRITGQTRVETLVGGTGAAKLHHFCQRCGDPVYAQIRALNDAVATFADKLSPFEFTADAHVWTSQKASGTQIPPDIKQSLGPPPDEIVARMVKGFWS